MEPKSRIRKLGRYLLSLCSKISPAAILIGVTLNVLDAGESNSEYESDSFTYNCSVHRPSHISHIGPWYRIHWSTAAGHVSVHYEVQ